MIKRRSATSTATGGTLDGDLFLVRHLLILKEITHNLDLVHQDEEDYQYGLADTLASMLNQTTSLLPGAPFASLAMPRNEEGIRDDKHGIDHDLKRVCEGIISARAAPLCARGSTRSTRTTRGARRSPPLPPASPLPKTRPLRRRRHSSNPLPRRSSVREFRASCERDLRSRAARLRLYLADRTVEVLLQHVRELVADEYALCNMYAAGMREGIWREEGQASVMGKEG